VQQTYDSMSFNNFQ